MDLRKERSLPKTEARAPTRQDKRIQRKDEGPAEMMEFRDSALRKVFNDASVIAYPKKNVLRPAPFSVDEIRMKGLSFINIQ